MTLKDLLKICGEKGSLPTVTNGKQEGVVTVIKPTGCAVRFDGMKWDTWHWAETKDDKRSKYMKDLKCG